MKHLNTVYRIELTERELVALQKAVAYISELDVKKGDNFVEMFPWGDLPDFTSLEVAYE